VDEEGKTENTFAATTQLQSDEIQLGVQFEGWKMLLEVAQQKLIGFVRKI
jgi:hypothetical protein